MCGICGKINHDEQNPVEESLLRTMCSTLTHRGPDDEGVYVKGKIGLGHCRLGIIDLSERGHQPMFNEDKTIGLVFNGEIYNFLRLRRELEQQGYTLRSQTDSEVLLRLYEKEGVECLEKLRGMFAFAIWDERKKLLFLARDRVGKKPLYYAFTKSAFLFASEIKALLQDPEMKREVNREAIHHYLTYQYVPAPLCAFEGIHKLPSAHYLLYQDGKIQMDRYWKLSYLPKWPAQTARQKRDLEKQLWDKIEESVCLRLNSDVPLGVLLSGGLDSSIVVAMMAGAMDKSVQTFSIGFSEKSYNELQYARQVAKRFHTKHTEFLVEPKALEILPKLVWHYNEPYADSSAIATYYACKMASEHVKVVLTGDGGDENFAGYERYLAAEWCRKLQRFFPRQAAQILRYLLLPLPCGHSKSFLWKLRRFLDGYAQRHEEGYVEWMSHFTPEMKSGLYTKDFANELSGDDSLTLFWKKYHESETDTPLERLMYSDIALYLPDDLLIKMDIASMANSLEARSPFLDHKLMEFAAALPSSWKLRGTVSKYILKKMYGKILPPEIVNRKKMGFGIPLDHWFRYDLKEMVVDVLLDPKSLGRGYFQKSFVEKMIREHTCEKWNWQYQLYNLLMLELWHREYIDQK